MANLSTEVISLRNLEFSYVESKPILKIPTLDIHRGEKIFLNGPSGSGKTTLLSILTGILAPVRGEVEILGTKLFELSESQRDSFRSLHIGYIFQMFNLIPYLSVIENMTLPCELNPERKKRIKHTSLNEEAHEVARALGIEEFLSQRATDLSVGQQQRVAAGRALLGAPEIVIADEPTSSLDFDHRERFLQLLFSVCKSANSTLIFVSHDRTLAHLFDRSLSLVELNLVRQNKVGTEI